MSQTLNKLKKAYHLKHGMKVNFEMIQKIMKENNMEYTDIGKLLGISKTNLNRISQNKNCTTTIKIISQEEWNKIQVTLQSKYNKKERITLTELKKISNQYEISEIEISRILNIHYNSFNRLLQKQTYVRLSIPKNHSNQEIINEVKYKEWISMQDINELKEKYEMSAEQIRDALNLDKHKFSRLRTGRNRKMRLDLLTKEEKEQIESKIMQICQGKDYITKQEIEKIKQTTKAKDSDIRKILSINSYLYIQLQKGECSCIRIINSRVKNNSSELLLDMKYQKRKNCYQYAELKKMCKKYHITVDEFLKGMSGRMKRYTFHKLALKENKEGLYIGGDIPISNEFLTSNYSKLDKICSNLSNKYCYQYGCMSEKEDFKQEAMQMILEKGGGIEKNFTFDSHLLFALLAKKAKCLIIGKCIGFVKEQQKILDIEKQEIHTKLTKDNEEMDLENNENMISYYQILGFEQGFLGKVSEYSDLIIDNRKYAIKVLSSQYHMSSTLIEKELKEIGKVILDKQMVKVCKDGSVISMFNKE